MIPMIAIVRIRNRSGTKFTLWLPLFLAWIVLLPFALIILPILALAFAANGIDAGKGLAALIAITCSLSGMLIEIENPRSSVLVRIE